MDLLTGIFGLGFGLGVMLLCLAIVVAVYVFYGLSHMKALKALGYDKAWLAWIPYGVYFGCADAVSQNEENVMLFNKFSIPSMVFKLWWVLPIVISFLPLNDSLINIVNRVLYIIFLGCTYAKMYARIEGKTEEETQVLGCVSGFLPIIAACKFIGLK